MDILLVARNATSLTELREIAEQEAWDRLWALPAVAVTLIGTMAGILASLADMIGSPNLDQLGDVVAMGIISFMAASLLGMGVWSVIVERKTRKLVRAVDEVAWRPRAGVAHPRGRSDTHARREIVRTVEGSVVTIGARIWKYDGVWQGSRIVQPRRFSLDELGEAVEYERELTADPVHDEASDARLLARWAEGRPDGFDATDRALVSASDG